MKAGLLLWMKRPLDFGEEANETERCRCKGHKQRSKCLMAREAALQTRTRTAGWKQEPKARRPSPLRSTSRGTKQCGTVRTFQRGRPEVTVTSMQANDHRHDERRHGGDRKQALQCSADLISS